MITAVEGGREREGERDKGREGGMKGRREAGREGERECFKLHYHFKAAALQQEFITIRVCNSHMVSTPAIWMG